MASLIEKAFRRLVDTNNEPLVRKASRGTLSSYVVNAPHQWGQPPIPQFGDVQGLITPERMREIVMRTPTAGAAMNAVLDYAVGVHIDVRNVDPAKPADDGRARYVRELLRKPNDNDNWRRFATRLERDLFTLGWAGVEIEPGKKSGLSRPANLWVLDGARLRVDYDEHGTVLGYNMLNAHGMPIPGPGGNPHAWLPEQVIWFEQNPISSSLYPSSRIQQLFTLGVLEDLMLAFISGRFTESNVPYGVMDLGDINETELKTAIGYWNSQANDKHRILLTGSKGGGLKFIGFNDRLKDLEASALLNDIRGRIMGILGVTMNELGDSQDINKSNGYNLSYTFKKRAIEPLLDEVCETLTTCLIWQTLGWKDLELYYEEIDSRDELLQAQIDDIYFKNGTWSINDIRNRKGLPNINGGEEPCIFTGSAYIPVSMIGPFAQAQLDAIRDINAETLEMIQQAKEAEAAAAQGGAAAPASGLKPQVSEPMIRPAQMPERYTTPDGRGSSTAKIKLLKPKLAPAKQAQGGKRPKRAAGGAAGPKNALGKTQRPRGAVQAARNAGIRKEDSQG